MTTEPASTSARDRLVDRLEALLPDVDIVPRPMGWVAAVAQEATFTALADEIERGREAIAQVERVKALIKRLHIAGGISGLVAGEFLTALDGPSGGDE